VIVAVFGFRGERSKNVAGNMNYFLTVEISNAVSRGWRGFFSQIFESGDWTAKENIPILQVFPIEKFFWE